MRKTKEITCRHGVKYSVTATGSGGSILRLWEMLSRCCCYVCYNRECKEPRNRKLRNCKHDCELFTREPYCQRKKKCGAK